jgi:hypothetical protein
VRSHERVQVLALMRIEPQGIRDRPENAVGWLNIAPLLEPRVPRQADVRELRHLLPPEPRHPPHPPASEPDIVWAEPSAARPQKRCQLASAISIGGSRRVGRFRS